MPKSLCVIDSVRAEIGPKFFVSYTISIDVPVLNFASEFQVDTALTVAVNLVNLKTKIVGDCLGRGVTLIATDVIVFGGPS